MNALLEPVRLGVSGHQQLPLNTVAEIRNSIRDLIMAAGPNALGVTSLAEGADQLFATEVLAADGALHVVLPSRKYEEAFASPAAAQDFRRLLGQAKTVEVLDFDAPSEAAYLAAVFAWCACATISWPCGTAFLRMVAAVRRMLSSTQGDVGGRYLSCGRRAQCVSEHLRPH